MDLMKNSWLALAACLLLYPADETVAQLAGACLDVESLGDWYPVDSTAAGPNSRVPPPRDDYYLNAFPARIHLSDNRIGTTSFALLIPENSQQTPHSIRMWRQAGDTLIVQLSNGFGGVGARLLRSERAWKGTLRNFTDNFGTLLYERSISLSITECNSPPRIGADEDVRLPRTIDLEDGQRLELGSRLPQEIATAPRSSGALTVLSRAFGRFAGADTIVVVTGRASQRISRIELRFPREFDIGRVIGELTAAFGPGRAGTTSSWSNRTTTLYVFPGSNTRSHRVVLIDPRWERER
jgi:hypothetical protein